MKQFEVRIRKVRKSGNYEVDYICPGTGARRRNQFRTKVEAQTMAAELERKNRIGNRAFFMDTTIAELMVLHIENCPTSRVRERKVCFRLFYNHFGPLKLRAATKSELINWFEKIRKENNYSQRTLGAFKVQINHFFKWLVVEEYLAYSPCTNIRFKRDVAPRRPRNILCQEEIKQLLDEAREFSPEALYPYLCTLVHTGARKSEVLNLKWTDIDFKTMLIYFAETKNGQSRYVEMSEQLSETLAAQPRSCPSIFKNHRGSVLNRSALQRMINKFKAKYRHKKNWGCHDLRHSFAYNFKKLGGNMYQLQAILGHKSIQMTIDLYGRMPASEVSSPSPYNF